ncbi:glycerophosphodiester phosphodiesterase family protein [Moraxella caviae]
MVQLAKQYNISVGVWTCNNRADADELMRIGVHYIMSDVNLKGN